jgi:hypothetical protein
LIEPAATATATAAASAPILHAFSNGDRIGVISTIAILLNPRRNVVAPFQIGYGIVTLAVDDLGPIVVAQHRRAAAVCSHFDLARSWIDILNLADNVSIRARRAAVIADAIDVAEFVAACECQDGQNQYPEELVCRFHHLPLSSREFFDPLHAMVAQDFNNSLGCEFVSFQSLRLGFMKLT